MNGEKITVTGQRFFERLFGEGSIDEGLTMLGGRSADQLK